MVISEWRKGKIKLWINWETIFKKSRRTQKIVENNVSNITYVTKKITNKTDWIIKISKCVNSIDKIKNSERVNI